LLFYPFDWFDSHLLLRQNRRWECHSTLRNYNTWSRKFYRQIINVGHSIAMKQSNVLSQVTSSEIHGDEVTNLLDKIKGALWISVYNLYEQGNAVALLAVWFLVVCHTLRPRRWRHNVPPKRRYSLLN
jgi:hypothetical protein